jgi:uncharacterized protein (TIGR02246 family)
MNARAPRASDIDVKIRLDIQDLYARASHASDASDGVGWAETFVPNGVFVTKTYDSTVEGRAALAAFIESSNGAAWDRGEQFRHLITALTMWPLPDGRIGAKAFLTITATSTAGTRIDRSVVMTDELAEHDGEWLFTRREAAPDTGGPQ